MGLGIDFDRENRSRFDTDIGKNTGFGKSTGFGKDIDSDSLKTPCVFLNHIRRLSFPYKNRYWLAFVGAPRHQLPWNRFEIAG